MTEVMIDIETLSTETNAKILSIGAIIFNRNNYNIKDIAEYSTFYKRVYYIRDDEKNFDISEETKKWWQTQDAIIREELFCDSGKVLINNALKDLGKFIPKNSKIWAKSPDFDCVILESAFKYYNIEIPWEYYNKRDVRTIMDVSFLKDSDFLHIKENKHHSLYDCYYQISILHECFKRLKE